MKNKMLLILFTFLSIVLFNNKVEALECLYESTDGDQIAINQFISGDNDYIAYASPVGTITVDGTEITDFTPKVYNSDEIFNSWKKTETCYEKLMYNESFGSDEVYVCNDWNDCKKGDKKFYLKEPYSGKTPENVGLKEMRCTYESPNNTGYKKTYSFLIKLEKQSSSEMNGSYSLWYNYDKLYDNDFDKTGINETVMSPFAYLGEKSYMDSFTIRTFWDEEKGYFQCPDTIAVTDECEINALLGSSDCAHYIGYKYSGESDYKSSNLINISSVKHNVYTLSSNASYIEYDSNYSENSICAYTYEDKICNPDESNCTPDIKVNLIKRSYPNGIEEIFSAVNTNYQVSYDMIVDTKINKININSCDDLPEIYTDCMNNQNSNTCKVTETEFEGSEKLVTNEWSNTQDITDVIEGMAIVNGLEYKQLVCDLSSKLKSYTSISSLKLSPSLTIYDSLGETKSSYNITNLKCSDWNISTGYSCSGENCKDILRYSIQNSIIEIKEYCNNIYTKYANKKDNNIFKIRTDECISFTDFHNYLIKENLIEDLSAGCGFISDELYEKLDYILDIIKIAAPLLAIGLGMLDFVKVIAAGDADKEMKAAFNRFSRRLIAAALLFIIPAVLSLILNIFLHNEPGYDEDNPFCNLVDYESKNNN